MKQNLNEETNINWNLNKETNTQIDSQIKVENGGSLGDALKTCFPSKHYVNIIFLILTATILRLTFLNIGSKFTVPLLNLIYWFKLCLFVYASDNIFRYATLFVYKYDYSKFFSIFLVTQVLYISNIFTQQLFLLSKSNIIYGLTFFPPKFWSYNIFFHRKFNIVFMFQLYFLPINSTFTLHIFVFIVILVNIFLA